MTSPFKQIILTNKLEILKGENPELTRGMLDKRFTYANPKFQEARRLKLSTWGIPPQISLVDETDEAFHLPRGLIVKVYTRGMIIEDKSILQPVDFQPSSIVLKDFQIPAYRIMMGKNQGVISMPCGSGKTIVAIKVIIERGQRCLILVHTKDLATQWLNRFKEFTNIEPGIIGEGFFDVRDVTIGMVQSLCRPLDPEFLNSFGLVLLDEAHHCPATTFNSLISQFPARFRFGLSATPERQDGLSFLMTGTIGRIIYQTDRSPLFDSGHIIKPMIKAYETGFYVSFVADYHQLLEKITTNPDRNDLILNLISREGENHYCLVLSERIRHVEALHDAFKTKWPEIPSAHITSHTPKEHREAAIDGMNKGNIRVIFATQIANEGLDIRRLDRVFLTCPIRSANKIIQQTGRCLRTFPGKENAIIFDFIDDCGLAKSQWYTRKSKAYKDFLIEKVPFKEVNFHAKNRIHVPENTGGIKGTTRLGQLEI